MLKFMAATVTASAVAFTAFAGGPAASATTSPTPPPPAPSIDFYGEKFAPSDKPQEKVIELPGNPALCEALERMYPDSVPQDARCGVVRTLRLEPFDLSALATGDNYVQASVTDCASIGCSAWRQRSTSNFRYNSSKKYVYSEWVTCNDNSGWPGISFTINWCGKWNNGGGNGYGYMNAGANYTVTANYNGLPTSANYWQRVNCDYNGFTSTSSG